MSGAICRVFRRLRAGGMAEVHLGVVRYESGFQKVCAVKKILGDFATDANFIELLREEARIGQNLSHANVVQTLGFDVIDGGPALIMEYVKGVDLATVIRRVSESKKQIPAPIALMICADVARALEFVHSQSDAVGREMSIIHCDISPSNILISFAGEVKLSDFGIAVARIHGDPTGSVNIRGKPSYMAPEQLLGGKLSAATDVFGLGCVLWEILAGQRLLPDIPSHERTLHLNTRSLTHLIDKHVKVFLEDLYRIFPRCLASEARDRYQTAGELEQELLRLLHSGFPNFTRQVVGEFVLSYFQEEMSEADRLIRMVLAEDAKAGEPPRSDKAPQILVNVNLGGDKAPETHLRRGRDLELLESGASAVPVPPAAGTGAGNTFHSGNPRTLPPARSQLPKMHPVARKRFRIHPIWLCLALAVTAFGIHEFPLPDGDVQRSAAAPAVKNRHSLAHAYGAGRHASEAPPVVWNFPESGLGDSELRVAMKVAQLESCDSERNQRCPTAAPGDVEFLKRTEEHLQRECNRRVFESCSELGDLLAASGRRSDAQEWAEKARNLAVKAVGVCKRHSDLGGARCAKARSIAEQEEVTAH